MKHIVGTGVQIWRETRRVKNGVKHVVKILKTVVNNGVKKTLCEKRCQNLVREFHTRI